MKMKTPKFLFVAGLSALMAASLSSCHLDADPGPLREGEEEYSIAGFDRVEAGNSFDITIEQGDTYSVKVNGDRRNIADLDVKNIDGTLRIKFQKGDRIDYRQYTTYVTITMPGLSGLNFSGSVNSRVSGFNSTYDMDIELSGASEVEITGTAGDLAAELSGSSTLRGFGFETETATVDASGASKVEISASQELNAKASGASKIRYRGNPTLHTSSSGASTIGSAD